MNIQIDASNGWTEIMVDNHCAFSRFEEVVNILETKLEIEFTDRINDLDTYYWDFHYGDSVLCLHYNNYMGVSIFPKRLQDANPPDNQTVIKLAHVLKAMIN